MTLVTAMVTVVTLPALVIRLLYQRHLLGLFIWQNDLWKLHMVISIFLAIEFKVKWWSFHAIPELACNWGVKWVLVLQWKSTKDDHTDINRAPKSL